MSKQAFRSRILHCVADPAVNAERALQYYSDGILLVEGGRILALDHAQNLLPQIAGDWPIEHLPQHLLIPGFIDAHTHYPQTEMVAAHGEQLLGWLERCTFPTEAKFASTEYAHATAKVFIDELLRNGTTTAMVFGTVHPQSIDAFFAQCQQRGLRMIAGKVCMDRNAPAQLCDNVGESVRQSRALIQRWHGVARLQYAITPRFAPCCSGEQLQSLGRLLHEHADVYLQTHLAENTAEVMWVQRLFPEARSYLDVYERAGLLSRRSIFAHAIHIDASDCQRLSANHCAVAHCPTSNLFLGSGLFDLNKLQSHNVEIALGTDIGAGTSFSMLRTAAEAYKIQQLKGSAMDPRQAFYMATLGGARALDLEGTVGNFLAGNEADFLLLDLQSTPYLQYRMNFCHTIEEILFALIMLGDDRVVARTYAMGECLHNASAQRN